MAEKKTRVPPRSSDAEAPPARTEQKFSSYVPPTGVQLKNDGGLKAVLRMAQEVKRLGDLLEAKDSSGRVVLEDFRKNVDAMLEQHVTNDGVVVEDLKTLLGELNTAVEVLRSTINSEGGILDDLRRSVDNIGERLTKFGKSANTHADAMAQSSAEIAKAVVELKQVSEKISSTVETPLGRSSAGEQKRLVSPAAALQSSQEKIVLTRLDTLLDTVQNVRELSAQSTKNSLVATKNAKEELRAAIQEAKDDIIAKLGEEVKAATLSLASAKVPTKSSAQDRDESSELISLKKKVTELTAALEEKDEEIKEKDQVIAASKAKPKTVRIDVGLEEKHRRLAEEHEILRNQFAERGKKIEELQAKITEYEQEIEKLKEHVKNVEAENAKLKAPKPTKIADVPLQPKPQTQETEEPPKEEAPPPAERKKKKIPPKVIADDDE